MRAARPIDTRNNGIRVFKPPCAHSHFELGHVYVMFYLSKCLDSEILVDLDNGPTWAFTKHHHRSLFPSVWRPYVRGHTLGLVWCRFYSRETNVSPLPQWQMYTGTDWKSSYPHNIYFHLSKSKICRSEESVVVQIFLLVSKSQSPSLRAPAKDPRRSRTGFR